MRCYIYNWECGQCRVCIALTGMISYRRLKIQLRYISMLLRKRYTDSDIQTYIEKSVVSNL